MTIIGGHLETSAVSAKFVRGHMDAYLERMDVMSKMPYLEVTSPAFSHCTQREHAEQPVSPGVFFCSFGSVWSWTSFSSESRSDASFGFVLLVVV